MRKSTLITIVILILIAGGILLLKITETGEKEIVKFAGYKVDNTNNIGEKIKNAYSIMDFEKYFGKYSLGVYHAGFRERETEGSLKIKDIEKQFAVEIIRSSKKMHYTVYRIKEGGYYYIFWFNGTDNEIYAFDTFYISSSNYVSDISKYKKIQNIDELLALYPYTEIEIKADYGSDSYNIMSKSELVSIKYDYLKGKGYYTVREITTLDRNDNKLAWTMLSAILERDLP